MTNVVWQMIAAEALEAQAERLGIALAELGVVHAILESRNCGGACQQIRNTAARLRTERNAIIDEARARRAAVAPENGARPRKGTP